jgi:hypothetical protein
LFVCLFVRFFSPFYYYHYCFWVRIFILLFHRIYSPISRLDYKSDTFFEANFEVFAIFSSISRYQFLQELVDNFRSMNFCIYWFQIKIFLKKTPIINCLLNNQIYTIALIHFTCILLKYRNATSMFNLEAIFSTNHLPLLELCTLS